MGELYAESESPKISGPKGFKLYFGKSDDNNQLLWDFGGWQNQDSALNSSVDGIGSCLTQSIFNVEPDIEYALHWKYREDRSVPGSMACFP